MRPELLEYRRLLRVDFERNSRVDSRSTLVIWRLGQCFHGSRGVVPFLFRRVAQVLDWIWIRGYLGALLPPHVQVGPGLRLPHCGRGVVLHHTVRIGERCTLYHQVTVGVKDDSAAATIGDNVYIGAGAKILGPVSVGSHVRVGANAVVVSNVPSGSTAVGVPAVYKFKR